MKSSFNIQNEETNLEVRIKKIDWNLINVNPIKLSLQAKMEIWNPTSNSIEYEHSSTSLFCLNVEIVGENISNTDYGISYTVGDMITPVSYPSGLTDQKIDSALNVEFFNKTIRLSAGYFSAAFHFHSCVSHLCLPDILHMEYNIVEKRTSTP